MSQSSPNQQIQVAIVGAGLAGLYLAWLLVQQRGASWAQSHLRIYEARSRVGGRILGQPAEQAVDRVLDLGPSWVWPRQQPSMTRLLTQLELPVLQQWQQGAALYQAQRNAAPQRFTDTQTYADACRLAGGAMQLINALLAQLPAECVHLNHGITALQRQDDHISLLGNNQHINAHKVVLTLPPRLLQQSIQFDPPLADPLQQMLQNTPTWMAGHAKVAIQYSHAFWREQGYSGAAMAGYPGAPMAEIFDACGPGASPAVLGGFMALPPAMREEWRADLPALILDQLIQLFGDAAAQPLALHIQDWSQEPYTAVAADQQPLTEHPQYGHPWLELDHWDDKLYFCGTETSSEAGGYMEGALQAAERVVRVLA